MVRKIHQFLVCLVFILFSTNLYAEFPLQENLPEPPQRLSSEPNEEGEAELTGVVSRTSRLVIEGVTLGFNVATFINPNLAHVSMGFNFLSTCQMAYCAYKSENLSDIYWAFTALKVGAVTSLSSVVGGKLSFIEAIVPTMVSSFSLPPDVIFKFPKDRDGF